MMRDCGRRCGIFVVAVVASQSSWTRLLRGCCGRHCGVVALSRSRSSRSSSCRPRLSRRRLHRRCLAVVVDVVITGSSQLSSRSPPSSSSRFVSPLLPHPRRLVLDAVVGLIVAGSSWGRGRRRVARVLIITAVVASRSSWTRSLRDRWGRRRGIFIVALVASQSSWALSPSCRCLRLGRRIGVTFVRGCVIVGIVVVCGTLWRIALAAAAEGGSLSAHQ
jgi:hypothetical protein